MSRLGKAELVHDRMLTIDEVLHRMESVTLEECREVAKLYAGPEILAIVGP
jgi:predicted Zn-dependent peptidase